MAGGGGAACRRAPLGGGADWCRAMQARAGIHRLVCVVCASLSLPPPFLAVSSAFLYPLRRWDEVAARCEEAVTAFEAAGAMDQVRRGAPFARAEAARAPLKAAARGEDG